MLYAGYISFTYVQLHTPSVNVLKMTTAFRTILWSYFTAKLTASYGFISSEVTTADKFFPSSIHSKERSNDTNEYHTSAAQFKPNITCFTYGTTENQEDNIPSQEMQTASIIFLHGLGSTGKKTKEAILLLKPNHTLRYVKIIFPTAPLIPYTPRNGSLNRAWFDKISTNNFSPEDPETLRKGMKDLRELISREVASGISLNRIVIGGFSLGGAMALNVAYGDFVKQSQNLAGVFALSAYLHQNSLLYEELNQKELENAPPLYYGHGKKDKTVLYKWGNETFERLKSYGIPGEFNGQSKVEHKISTKGFQKLMEWFERILQEN